VIGAQSGFDREASVQARERAVRGICRPLAGAPPWERDGYRTRGRAGLVAQSLTTSIVYVAAARKVQLTSVESTLTGDMDVRGALGVSDEPRNGFERISASFRVTGNARGEAARRRGARPGALGRLRHGHQRRARRRGGHDLLRLACRSN
jgi:hypothetical protein